MTPYPSLGIVGGDDFTLLNSIILLSVPHSFIARIWMGSKNIDTTSEVLRDCKMIEYKFLDLPGEIRNQIYRELLIVPALSKPRLLGDPPIYPQILSTCRKVHEEARQILYGCNTFLAHSNLLSDVPRLRLYYGTITSPTLISLIRRYHIRVRLDCDPNFSIQKATDAFSGVEELTLEVFQAQFGSCDHKVLRLFEGVRGVRNARIYGSVTLFPEYARWLQSSMITPIGGEVLPFDKSGLNRLSMVVVEKMLMYR